MNDGPRASFWRRLAAFAVDAIIVVVLGSAVLAATTMVAVGVLPDTPSHILVLADAANTADANPAYLVVLGYFVASWTPLFGRRSLGMRMTGLRVVRDAS